MVVDGNGPGNGPDRPIQDSLDVTGGHPGLHDPGPGLRFLPGTGLHREVDQNLMASSPGPFCKTVGIRQAGYDGKIEPDRDFQKEPLQGGLAAGIIQDERDPRATVRTPLGNDPVRSFVPDSAILPADATPRPLRAHSSQAEPQPAGISRSPRERIFHPASTQTAPGPAGTHPARPQRNLQQDRPDQSMSWYPLREWFVRGHRLASLRERECHSRRFRDAYAVRSGPRTRSRLSMTSRAATPRKTRPTGSEVSDSIRLRFYRFCTRGAISPYRLARHICQVAQPEMHRTLPGTVQSQVQGAIVPDAARSQCPTENRPSRA